MNKNHLIAYALSVVLAASAAMTCYAATENHSDGQSHTVNSDVVNTDDSRTAVSAEKSGTSVTVNGDVESAGWGADAKEGGTVAVNGDLSSERTGVKSCDSGSSVTVNGNVSTGNGNGVDAENHGEVTVTGNVETSSETASAVWASDGASVSVGGNAVNSDAVTTGDHVPNVVVSKNDSSVEVKGDVKGTAYGVSATNNSTIDVGGSVESDLRGVNANNSSSVSVGGNVNVSTLFEDGVCAENQSQVTVNGSVAAGGTAVNACSNSSVSISGDAVGEDGGVSVAGNSAVSIGGSVTNHGGSGCDAVSVWDNSTADIGGNVISGGTGVEVEHGSKVTVGGNVEGGGMFGAVQVGYGSTLIVEGNVVNNKYDEANHNYSDGISMTSDSKVIVKGDVAGGGSGISIWTPDNSIDGEPQPVTTPNSDGAVVVLGTITPSDKDDSYCILVDSGAMTEQEVLLELPTIIVGELSSKNGNYVYFNDHGSDMDAEKVAQAIADQILYYIDVQETKNGNIKIDSGTTKVMGYDVAHANDTVTVTVTADRGYEIQTVDGGKATAVKNEDGSWSITVPATGGVSISAIMAAIKKVDDSTGGGGSGGGGGGIFRSTSSQKQPEYVSENAADGSTVHVYGETEASDGTKSGVVLSDSDVRAGLITVYTGAGKTAGLPADVVNTIRAVEGGNLAAVPGVDLTGKKAVGGSMAMGIIPDGVRDVPVSLYAAGIPAGAVPYILFYNNMTGEWILIPATIDPVTGLVVFVLPDDGTAIIVY